MNAEAFRIFVVDDVASMRLWISDQLANRGYDIHEFSSGEACLSALDLQPSLIILDIDMPGKNGLETCRELRALGHTDVQVLFFSAGDDLDSRLLAFDAGGNDYIQKNAEGELLLLMVGLAFQAEKKAQALYLQLSYTQQTAMTALSSLGEMGSVLQFLRTSFSCQTIDQLAVALIQAIESYGLTGLVKLSSICGESNRNRETDCSPLEASILSYVSRLGRLYQMSDRLGVNYPHATILVSGLELDDLDRVGRLRDHLALLVEGADARIISLEEERQRTAQSTGIIQGVTELTTLLADVNERQSANHTLLLDTLDVFRQDLEASFFHLGLTDNQETWLHDKVEQLNQRLAALFDADDELAERLNQIVTNQKKLLTLD